MLVLSLRCQRCFHPTSVDRLSAWRIINNVISTKLNYYESVHNFNCLEFSLRASSPLARLVSLAQIGELARRLFGIVRHCVSYKLLQFCPSATPYRRIFSTSSPGCLFNQATDFWGVITSYFWKELARLVLASILVKRFFLFLALLQWFIWD